MCDQHLKKAYLWMISCFQESLIYIFLVEDLLQLKLKLDGGQLRTALFHNKTRLMISGAFS